MFLVKLIYFVLWTNVGVIQPQQLLVYLHTVYACVRACVRVVPYFVMRTFLEEVNSMEGNEETAGCGMLIQ